MSDERDVTSVQVEWLISPGPGCRTGVPKPEWYGKDPADCPPSVRTFFRIIYVGLQRGYPSRMDKALKDPDLDLDSLPVVGIGNVSDAWPYLTPGEQKTMVQAFAEAYDVDIVVYRHGQVEFVHPRKDQPTPKKRESPMPKLSPQPSPQPTERVCRQTEEEKELLRPIAEQLTKWVRSAHPRREEHERNKDR